MESKPPEEDANILLRIQNSGKPEQVIILIVDESRQYFVTQGINEWFGVDEIRIPYQEVMRIPQYARVLSFLVETMSVAQDLNLPYTYQDEFDFEGERYFFVRQSGFRLLNKI